LFEFSLVGAFVFQSNVENYDPPLWTMFYEFLGSFMVFATVALVRSWRMRTWILAILFVALALCEPFFSLFVAEILVADVFRQDGSSRSRNIAGATLCAAGLLLTLLPAPWVLFKYVAAPSALWRASQCLRRPGACSRTGWAIFLAGFPFRSIWCRPP